MKIKTLVFALLSCLCLQAMAQEDIIDRLNKTLGVHLPAEYEAKVRNTARSNETMRKGLKLGGRFTEEFIIKQMSTSWGIDKQNQLIFIWSAIYEKITKQELYDGSDGDDKRVNDFGEIIAQWEICGNTYAAEYNAYIEKRIAELDKRMVDALIGGLHEVIVFYGVYIENPYSVKPEEISQVKDITKKIIKDCNEYNIDYHSVMLEELGDEKKVDEILKFYEVE